MFADDDLEADNNESSTICTIMKSVIRCVFQEINIKTDLDDAPVGKSIRYTGWLIDLDRRALKLPADKHKKILDKRV